MKENNPHILILMPDQMRADSMGCAGHPRIQTPTFDRLAAEGMRCTDAHTVSTVCLPARISFINGTYPHNHGMWYNRGELPANYPTFFSRLRDAGYYTATIGKSHYWSHQNTTHLRDGEPYMRNLGFEYIREVGGPRGTYACDSCYTDYLKEKGLYDLFVSDTKERVRDPSITRPSPFNQEDHMDGYVGRQAVDFVDNCSGDRPTCMFVGFPGPHDPWDAPDRFASMYDPAESPPPIPFIEHPETVPANVSGKDDFEIREDMTSDTFASIRANYDGKISFIDYMCGEILEAYRRRGWLDDLLVVFLSDHGEMAGDHGRVYKRIFYESALRIPLIIRWPGRIPEGAVCEAMVENIDVCPGILDAIGVEQLQMSLGQSIWHLAGNPGADHRSEILSEVYFGGSRNTMLKTRHFKYAMDQEGSGYMLYDMERDPEEQHNLIGDPKARKTELDMRDALLRRLTAGTFVMESVNH
ncbi:MAG: sulfatase-like hydrolase/transferase [Spirochaetales bacterium]|jgi:arylsulfatase|nr:sulfatase-like hydrolase/transferase [Spirochaetales bacterium]